MMISLFLPMLLALHAGSPVQWTFQAVPVEQGVFQVELSAQVEEGWHIYATELPSDLGPIPTTIRFAPSNAYQLIDGLEEPTPAEEFDPNFSMLVRHHSNKVVFRQGVRGTVENAVVSGDVEYMVCNDKTCLPPVVVPFTVPLPVIEKQ